MSSTLNHSSTTKSPDSLLGSFFNIAIPHNQMVSFAAITAPTPLPKSALWHSGPACFGCQEVASARPHARTDVRLACCHNHGLHRWQHEELWSV